MKIRFAVLLFLGLSGLMTEATGQTFSDTLSTENPRQDSIVIKQKKGSIFKGKPGKAMLMSLVIPGTGQIYNKSYLRVPFVWGAVGGVGYLVVKNTKEYNCLKDAYIASIDGVPYTFPDHCSKFDGITDSNRLKLLRDQANQNKQTSIIAFSLVWLANGIDAFVNAHLKEFDVNENLSFHIGTQTDDDPLSPMRMGLFLNF